MSAGAMTPRGTPYTVTTRGTATVVTVGTPGNPKAAKAVQQQRSGVWHSQDGQSFADLAAVADGMRWAL